MLDNIAPFYYVKWAGVKKYFVGVYHLLQNYHKPAPFYHTAAAAVKNFFVGVYPVWQDYNGSPAVHLIGASTNLGRTELVHAPSWCVSERSLTSRRKAAPVRNLVYFQVSASAKSSAF